MKYLEYLTSNELLNYPFTDGAVLTNGTVGLPTDLFLDAVIYAREANQKYYIKYLFQDGYNLTFRIFREDDTEIFTVSVEPIADNVRVIMTAIAIIDEYIYIGRFLFGKGLLTVVPPAEEQEYTVAQTQFLPSVIVPAASNVYSLAINESGGEILIDDVKLVAGCNISLEYNDEQNGIVISSGAAEGDECECEDPIQEVYIETINNIAASDAHNFRVEGSDCINISAEPGSNMIVVSDECRPCCGDCDTRLGEINTVALDTQTLITQLENRIINLGG